MKPYLCLLSGVCALISAGCIGVSQASVEPPVPVVVAPPPAEKGSLDELVAPIALYPDALVALILPAATTSSDVVLAARYLAGGGDREQLASQPWDDSVKALAHYPDIVKWMDENLSWTQRLGEAYLDEPENVMEAIQRDRARARAIGALADTEQQQVIVADGSIRIIPAQPEVIYIPRYDPQIVYVERPIYYSPDPWLTFGVGFGVGSWLAYDCDWRARTIWIDHHRHQRWREHRDHDWRHPRFPNRPAHSAYHPGWQRWRPTPDRHIEHRRNLDRHQRSGARPNPVVRMPESDRRGPSDRHWREGDRRRERPDQRINDQRRGPGRRPDFSSSPAAAAPGVQSGTGGTLQRPGLDSHHNRAAGPDRRRQPAIGENRDRGGPREGNSEHRRWRTPSPAQADSRQAAPPPVAGAHQPRRASPAMTPAPNTPARTLQRPERTHAAPPPAAIAARAPIAARPAAPAPAQVESRPAPAARQEARAERSSERRESRGGGRGQGAREHDR